MATTIVYGIIGLALGLFLFWLGRPNRDGTPRSYLRGSLTELLYPVVVLLFLVIGASQLISAAA